MATAAQYTAWASELGALGGDVVEMVGPLLAAWEARPVVGGNLSLVVHRAVEAAADHVGVVGFEVDDLAAECTRRAEICAAYSVALGGYEIARSRYLDALAALDAGGDGPAPVAPARPHRPASWADATPTSRMGPS